MARRGSTGGFSRLLRSGAAADESWTAAGLGTMALRQRRREAQAERRRIDSFLVESDLAVHLNRAQLADLPLPEGTDWRWRPALLAAPLDPAGRVGPGNAEGLGDSAKLFHDCNARALILRQIANRRDTDLARYGLSLEVLGFTGKFLSLALPLPAEALQGLDRGHVLQIDTEIEIERPLEIFARLNIANGPNTDRLQVHLGYMRPDLLNRHSSAFDLSMTEINPERLEQAWIDLIVEAPFMNRVVLRDLVMSRHRRADI